MLGTMVYYGLTLDDLDTQGFTSGGVDIPEAVGVMCPAIVAEEYTAAGDDDPPHVEATLYVFGPRTIVRVENVVEGREPGTFRRRLASPAVDWLSPDPAA
jgi:hypothetical protein